jgi:hypothetical protein
MKKTRLEHDEQAAVMNWCRVSEEMQTDPVKRAALRWVHAIPNGFHRGFAARRKAKAEGVKSGILDLCIPAPELRVGVRRSGGYHGLYVEMKRKGERARPTQTEFMDYLDSVHYNHALCFDWRAAAGIIAAHLDLQIHAGIPDAGEDDALVVHRLAEEARRLDEIRNPPKPTPDKPKRKSRPRSTAEARKKAKKASSK